MPGPRSSSSSLRDGPLVPRSDNNSQRRASRQPPEDLDHLFDGFDRAEADLSWTAPLPEDINPRTGELWLYPKKRGNGPSNLEDFREEIEERTRNGQGGKAIAEALIEKGVDTSGKAVSAQRLRWGIRTKVGSPPLTAASVRAALEQSTNASILSVYRPLGGRQNEASQTSKRPISREKRAKPTPSESGASPRKVASARCARQKSSA